MVPPLALLLLATPPAPTETWVRVPLAPPDLPYPPAMRIADGTLTFQFTARVAQGRLRAVAPVPGQVSLFNLPTWFIAEAVPRIRLPRDLEGARGVFEARVCNIRPTADHPLGLSLWRQVPAPPRGAPARP